MDEYKIKLTIDKDVFENIRTDLGFKRMTGNMYGVLDEFILLIIASIDNEKESIHIEKIKKGG